MQFTQSIQFSGQADPVLDVISTDYKIFVLNHGTGVLVDYVILSETGTQWEVGAGELAVGGGFLRDTVTSNHLGTTAKVDFDVGRHLLLIDEVDSGGGASDGDKGDIVVSGGGATWTLDKTLDAIDAPVAAVDFAQQQAVQLVIENRTSDPGSPVEGQIWLRTDLA